RVLLRSGRRDVGIVSESGRISDDDAALLADLRRPLLGDRAAGGHYADVGVGEIVVLQRLHLQRLVAIGDLRADRAARGERHHLVGRKAALFEDIEHLAPDIAGGACDCNLETHETSPAPLRLLTSGGTRRPARASSPRARPGRDGKAKGDQTVLPVVLVVIVLALVVPETALDRNGTPNRPARRLPPWPGKSSARSAIVRPRIVRKSRSRLAFTANPQIVNRSRSIQPRGRF